VGGENLTCATRLTYPDPEGLTLKCSLSGRIIIKNPPLFGALEKWVRATGLEKIVKMTLQLISSKLISLQTTSQSHPY
jgi:hypothetical protein